MKTNAFARQALRLQVVAFTILIAALAILSADCAQSLSVKFGQLASGRATNPPVSTLTIGDYLSAAQACR